MQKIVKIGGKEYTLAVNARIPRQYRFHFKRDIIRDMMELEKAAKRNKDNGDNFEITDLTIFENIAWLMLKAGGEEVGNNPDEWLESIDGLFSIYEALPQIIELWQAGLTTTATPKKKLK